MSLYVRCCYCRDWGPQNPPGCPEAIRELLLFIPSQPPGARSTSLVHDCHFHESVTIIETYRKAYQRFRSQGVCSRQRLLCVVACVLGKELLLYRRSVLRLGSIASVWTSFIHLARPLEMVNPEAELSIWFWSLLEGHRRQSSTLLPRQEKQCYVQPLYGSAAVARLTCFSSSVQNQHLE